MNFNSWSGAIAAAVLVSSIQGAFANSPDLEQKAETDRNPARSSVANLTPRHHETIPEAASSSLVARLMRTTLQQPPSFPPPQNWQDFLVEDLGPLTYVEDPNRGESEPPEEAVVRGLTIYQAGEASWYGPGLDGNLTASGEVFRQDVISAAHLRLPFGTIVRIKNLDNGRSLDVRINDRGPYDGYRIIDVSRAAAAALGILDSGIANVEISIVE